MADLMNGTLEDRKNAATGGLTGLPITQDRARELGHEIAASLELDGLRPLMELLLGIAPHWVNEEDKPEDWSDISGDLWARYTSAIDAIEVLYTYSPEFREQVEAYILSLRPKIDPLEGIELTGDNRVKKVASKRAGEQGRGKR